MANDPARDADPSGVRRGSGSGSVTLRRLRTGSGLVMFAFVTMHLVNHTLLLVSIPFAERAREVLAGPWRGTAGTILLAGAAFVHVMLTLLSLYQRRTLTMPPGELLRVLFGLMIPMIIAQHVIPVRLSVWYYGVSPSYVDVLNSLVVARPGLGVLQSVALLIVWTHGCIGVMFLLRYRPWWRLAGPVFMGVAILLPVLALVGFGLAGRIVGQVRAISGNQTVLYTPLGPVSTESARISEPRAMPRARFEEIQASAVDGFRGAYVALIALVLLAREARGFYERARAITINYGGGRRFPMPRGASVLEASRANGIPQYAICGGNGRCSTCRVRVLQSDGPLPPRTQSEARTLERLGADADVRLACQLRPEQDLTVSVMLTPPPEIVAFGSGVLPPAPRERQVAVLFCDMRGFTAFSEARLPYDVVFLLNRYFAVVGDAVVESGGRIDKFIGDGAMALFGIDQEPEAACRGALMAARRIAAGIERLNGELADEIGTTLHVAIGLHFGPAVVGVMGFDGSMNETAIGDTVNVASRLEAIAKRENAVLAVSEAVLTAAGADLEGARMERFSIRGRGEPMQIGLYSDRMPRLADGASG